MGAISISSLTQPTAPPVIVFDGECVLCSGFFRFVLRHDKARKFRFVVAQSDLGARLYTELGLPTDDYQTNLVFTCGKVHTKANAFAAAMRELGWPWRVLSILRYVPDILKNPIYDRIARNRYKIFGRHDQCVMPDPHLHARFLEGGM